jgi:homoserine kinase type II
VAGRDDFQDASLDRAAAEVRDHYGAACCGALFVPLGNRGGFSGARLWRGEGAEGRFCQRAWPAHKTAARVRQLHRLMMHARGQGLDFVPAVYAASSGDTVVEAAGRVWELTQWLAGTADFSEYPSPARLDAAAESLARLHLAWEAFAAPPELCPAIRRRLKVLADWQALIATGWQPQRPAAGTVDLIWPVAERAWRGLPRWLEDVNRYLAAWLEFRCPVQPCLCDLWHDHLLFEGDRLTGLVDYGTVKPDHVAVDLSRMLGSLLGDDAEGWQRGLSAYSRVRPLEESAASLARMLDRTGTILGILNWLRWLYHEGRRYADLVAIGRRLGGMLDRIDSWVA